MRGRKSVGNVAPAPTENLEPRLLLCAVHGAHDTLAESERLAAVASTPAAVAAVGTPRLPDLTPLADVGRDYVYGWQFDTKEIPGHTLLRLTTAMGNGGAGPLELRGGAINPDGTQNVYQRVFLEGGGFSDRLAGTFTYHPSHNHTHFDNFSAYRLRAVAPDGGAGEIVAAGEKISFCLLDVDHYAPSLPGSPTQPRYVTCDTFQGVSPGWADVYDLGLPDQWIDVTDAPDGRYWLEVAVDPANHLLESDETNNVVRVPIDLVKPPQDPMVVSHAPSGQYPAPVGSIDFNFDQPMDPASFDAAQDVTRFSGPRGADLRAAITGYSWLDDNTLRVTFATQAAEGTYAMAIGPQILAADDAAAMDQDRDKTPGEAGQDGYVATFTVASRVGPDAFGYEARATPFEPIALVAGAPGVTTVLDNEDDAPAAVSLGGNTFNFYGTVYTGATSLFANTNGLITFTRGVTSYNNGDLTSDPTEPAIAPLWDDWRTDTDAADVVLARLEDVDGDGVSDRLVVEWSNVRRYSVDEATGGPNPAGAVTFQAILTLNTGPSVPGAIVFNYPDLDSDDGFSNGASATVGIKGGGAGGVNRLLVSQDGGAHPLVASGKAIRVSRPPASVVGRHVFYNHSAFDGGGAAADAADDGAIAPDKSALLRAQVATFANATSYLHGLNGVMVDIANWPTTLNPAPSDFAFKVTRDNQFGSWDAAPAPLSVTVRRGAGDGGSDRVSLVWADGAIVDKWLQVTVLATTRTRLAAPDVFAFGNLVGETGDRPAVAVVNALDLAGVRRHLSSVSSVDGAFDFNRDGRVNALDLAAVRSNLVHTLVMPTAADTTEAAIDDRVTALLK
jgi:hypothetical protein